MDPDKPGAPDEPDDPPVVYPPQPPVEELPDEDAPLAGLPELEPVYTPEDFRDVAPETAYFSEISRIMGLGLMGGTGDGLFAPDAPLTRAMAAAILYRMHGASGTGNVTDFTDIPDGSYFADAVAWAAGAGMVSGIDSAHFAPYRPITRQDLLVMLWRYAAALGLDTSVEGEALPERFTDLGLIDAWAEDAVTWAFKNGLIAGRSETKLDPRGRSSRAETCVILTRFLELEPPAGDDGSDE